MLQPLDAAALKELRVAPFRISKEAYSSIIDALSGRTAECGGIIGRHASSCCAEYFMEDKPETYEADSYTPNVQYLNECLRLSWNPAGIRLAGLVHTHREYDYPSLEDTRYAKEIFDTLGGEPLALLIAFSPDCRNPCTLHPYMAAYMAGVFRLAATTLQVE